MKKALNQNELQLAAIVLERAADHFANHSCNDFCLPKSWTQQQCDAFLLTMQTWNGDPEEFEPGERLTQDWFVMRYLAATMKELAE